MNQKSRCLEFAWRVFGGFRRRGVSFCVRKGIGRKWLVTIVSLLFFLDASAQPPNTVVVVATRQGGAYQDFIQAFEASLGESKGTKSLGIRVVVASALSKHQFDEYYSKARLVVTVGTLAAQTVLKMKISVPVLSTLVPRSSYRVISSDNAGARLSSIYLDQPLERRFRLIETLLPGSKNVSVVLGPSTVYMQNELQSLARIHRLRIKTEKMSPNQRLAAPLNRVLEDSNVFLAVADPVVSNRRTVQNLLLTTYRHRVPVIAYSRAYVKAGALAAVYSTPQQIGKQAGELVGGLVRSGNWTLPSPQYPKYFSVDINRQVAQSLGIHVPGTAEVVRKLRQEKEAHR